MALGTAPHRIAPGVWATRDGRRLTPQGSAWWEHHHQQGLVTTDGHTTPRAQAIGFGKAIAPTRSVLPAPPPVRHPVGQPTITPGQWAHTTPKQKMATEVTVPYKGKKYNVPIGFGGASAVDRQMAAQRQAEAAARAAYIKAHPQKPKIQFGKQATRAQRLQAARYEEAHPSAQVGIIPRALGIAGHGLDIAGGAVADMTHLTGLTDRLEHGNLRPSPTPGMMGSPIPGVSPTTIHAGGAIEHGLSSGLLGPDLTKYIESGGVSSKLGLGVDVAGLLPLPPLGKGLRALRGAARASKAAEEAAKAGRFAVDVEKIPERVTRVEEWQRAGIPEDQIKQALAVYDNQAALHPGGPEAFWRDRIGHPSGVTAEAAAAAHAKQLFQAPEPHIPHPETPEAAALKAQAMPSRKTIFNGVDMSVFREHNIDDFLKKIPQYLQRGAPYRYWYEDSGKAILRYAGGDKEEAARIAQVVAIYSASRQPRENINLAMQALREYQDTGNITVGRINKWKDMEKGKPKPVDQADKAMMVMRGEDWGGRKTNRFYANMLKWIDEPRYLKEFPGGEVTNDIWMARLFGLKSDVPTPREYDQMTRITQNIANQLGWSPEEIQAALWVPAKADAGRTVTGKGGAKIRTVLSDHEAGMDFARALDQEASQMAVEAVPGRRVAPELYAAYQGLTREAKRSYFNEKMAAVARFLREARAFGEVSAEGVGIWKNEANPAFTLTFPLGGGRAELGAGKKATLSTTSSEGQKFMTAMLSHVGEALHQDAMAWFRPFYRRDPISKQNGALLELSRPLTEEETLRFHQGLKAHFGSEIPLPPAAGNDLFVLNFSGAKHADFHAALNQILEDSVTTEISSHRVPFRFDGDYRTRSQYAEAARHLDGGRGYAGSPHVQEAARRLHDASRGIDERYLGSGRAEPSGLGRTLHQRPAEPASALPKGATEFLAGGKSRLHFFEGADISTLMHELFHVSVHDLRGSHLDTLAHEFAGGKELAQWTDAEHEAVAQSFEQWLRTGEVTNPKLKGAFNAIKDWMLALVGRAKDAGMVVPKDVEDAFNHMFRKPHDVPLEQQVVKAAKRAPAIYAAQKLERSAAMQERVGKMLDAGSQATGQEAHRLQLEALRGEMPTTHVADLTHLTSADLDYLQEAVQTTKLRPLEKLNLFDAIKTGQQGGVLTPRDVKLVLRAWAPPGTPMRGRTPTEWALHLINEIVNIPRSIMASGDVSGVFRQALMAFAMHPVLVTKEMGPMFKYLLSEKKYLADMRWLAEDPKAQLMSAHGTEFTDLGHQVSGREEQFVSSYAEWITGGKHGLVRRSGRAYTGLLNNTRYALNDNMYRIAEKQGIDLLSRSPEVTKELQSMSKVANWATGRGHLSGLETETMLLNTFLFSPRLLKSRVDMLNPFFYGSLGKGSIAQKQALRGVVSLIIGGASVLAMAKLAGTDVVLDPFSSDFGKIKVGNHRFDIWGGHQQIARTVMQELFRRKTIVSTGETKPQHQFEPTMNFFRGKLSPPVGFIVDVAHGKNIIGQKITPKMAAYEHLTPLAWQDAIESYLDDNNLGWGLGTGVLAQIGVGAQTFPTKAPSSGGGGYFGNVDTGGGGSYWGDTGGDTGSSYWGTP